MIRKIMGDNIDVKAGISEILKRIEIAYNARPKEINAPKPKLVAVSKTKPIEMIIDAYATGQRDFGENYVQELVEKSSNPVLIEKCPDIRWHFIGRMQNNKISKVLKCPGINMIQTVESEKLANNLNSSWSKLELKNKEPLQVLIQINTSGEIEKNGINPSEAPSLYKHIQDNLPNLQLQGIMTIGAFGHNYAEGPNPDFITLTNCRKEICRQLNLNENEFEVSMGMSDDFHHAIDMGSTIVRVGSSIFGYRQKK